MKVHARGLAAGLCLGALLVSQAQAADKPPVKIGILTDMSGTYAGMGARGRWRRRSWPSTTAWLRNARA